jgi:hypothetical protein
MQANASLGFAYLSGNAKISDPGASGTFDLRGLSHAAVVLTTTGSYTLPSVGVGTELFVTTDDTSTITLVDGAGSTVAVFTGTSGTSGVLCKQVDANSWAATGYAQSSVDGLWTAANVSIADAGSFYTGTTVEAALQEIYRVTNAATATSTTYNNTDGTGTLAAAAIVGGVINRTGETAAYTDTTDDAANLSTALGLDGPTFTWILYYRNTVAFPATLAAGTDVTLAGNTVIPGNSVGVFHVSVNTVAVTATITGLGSYRQCTLPNAKYTTTAAASPLTAAAGDLTGANHVFFEITTDGAFGLTTRTATQMFGDIPNCHIGYTYLLTIVNRGNNTVTITAGSNVTITASENTIATLVTRTYLVNFTSATACTFTSLSKGTIET